MVKVHCTICRKCIVIYEANWITKEEVLSSGFVTYKKMLVCDECFEKYVTADWIDQLTMEVF